MTHEPECAYKSATPDAESAYCEYCNDLRAARDRGRREVVSAISDIHVEDEGFCTQCTYEDASGLTQLSPYPCLTISAVSGWSRV